LRRWLTLGSERRHYEENPLKKIAYGLLGEIHIPGRIRAVNVLRSIKKIVGGEVTNMSILDAGCGKGMLSFTLAKKYPAWRITGVDMEATKIEKLNEIKEKLGMKNLQFHQKDLNSLESSESYDIILNCDVLEHMEDDERVIHKFWKALKQGGYLILTFPSLPQRKHLRFVKWRERKIGFKLSDYGHARRGYSITEIKDKLRRIGFTNIQTKWTYGFWGTLAFDLFFVIGDNRPNPLIFAILFPFLSFMGMLDVNFPPKSGSGLLVVSQKNVTGS
jgi:ubiquinone/menaquinone biosynthesis C-methylase UbiE